MRPQFLSSLIWRKNLKNLFVKLKKWTNQMYTHICTTVQTTKIIAFLKTQIKKDLSIIWQLTSEVSKTFLYF